MAAPRYRLQALLVVRRQLKKKAEERLARSIRRLREEKEKLKALEDEKRTLEGDRDKARRNLSSKMASGRAVAGEGHRHVNYLRRIEEEIQDKEREIEEQKIILKEAEEAALLAKREYVDACKALKIMEKHKELWEKKVYSELTRKEAKELDELGQTIHQLKKWRGEKPLYEV